MINIIIDSVTCNCSEQRPSQIQNKMLNVISVINFFYMDMHSAILYWAEFSKGSNDGIPRRPVQQV